MIERLTVGALLLSWILQMSDESGAMPKEYLPLRKLGQGCFLALKGAQETQMLYVCQSVYIML